MDGPSIKMIEFSLLLLSVLSPLDSDNDDDDSHNNVMRTD